MARLVKIDPLTRIEGHLAFHVEVENQRIVNAFCSGEMFRGFEAILQGRHPLDAQQVTHWNCSPRDDQGQPGAVKQALIGTPVLDEHQPLEAARVVRSFDPCIACAVH